MSFPLRQSFRDLQKKASRAELGASGRLVVFQSLDSGSLEVCVDEARPCRFVRDALKVQEHARTS